MLFLEDESGKVLQKIQVGEGLSKPIIQEKFLYVITADKVYKFENTRFQFKFNLFIEKFKNFIF